MTTHNHMTKTALVIIDVQNDYFVDGAYPQWQVNEMLERTLDRKSVV